MELDDILLIKSELDSMKDNYAIRDGDPYETIQLDLPPEVYDFIVTLAGSEDEYEMSLVLNKLLSRSPTMINLERDEKDGE